jgi:hypothetical protein
MKVEKPMSDQSILWGYSISWWDWFGARAMVAGAVLGVLALLISFIASYVLYRVADIAQSELQSKTKDLDKEIGGQKERTEELRSANLALEARIAPRRLSHEQQRAIAVALFPFAGQSVIVRSYMLDVESAILGGQIIDVLNAAKIVPTDKRMAESSSNAVALAVHVVGNNKALVVAILTSLADIGHLLVSPDPPPPPMISQGGSGIYGPATIFVGIKPINTIK